MRSFAEFGGAAVEVAGAGGFETRWQTDRRDADCSSIRAAVIDLQVARQTGPCERPRSGPVEINRLSEGCTGAKRSAGSPCCPSTSRRFSGRGCPAANRSRCSPLGEAGEQEGVRHAGFGFPNMMNSIRDGSSSRTTTLRARFARSQKYNARIFREEPTRIAGCHHATGSDASPAQGIPPPDLPAGARRSLGD